MRELHAWQADRRHAPDAAADTMETRGHDAPKHEVLRDPATRIPKHDEYRKIVEATEAKWAAEQPKPEWALLAHAPSDVRDSPVSEIAQRLERATGARGIVSGREFDPELAGGPIQPRDASAEKITSEGVEAVAAHLDRFAGGGTLEPAEKGMLDRLTSIKAGHMAPTSYDQNFYTHELDEAGRYAQLGYGPESGADLGSSELYDVWNNVHTASLEDYGISGAELFYPGLAP
jgi:hypothetical protein